jgi:hypothetical protein
MASKRSALDPLGPCAKLMRLGKASFVSQSGIAKLLKVVADEGTPSASSRVTQWRARKATCSTPTAYGPLVNEVALELTDGKVVTVGMQNCWAMLQHNLATSPDLAAVFRRAIDEHPPSSKPWRIIVYQDGVDPSDGLSKNHSRKSVVFYASFLELGMDALAHEEVWMTPIVIRYNLVTKLAGQHAQVATRVMEQFFTPHDVKRCGVSFKLYGEAESVRIFADVGVLLADEPALKEVLSCKGHAGNKPCVLCKNAVLQKLPMGAVPLHERSEYAVSIAETDMTKFQLHTDASILATVARLNGYKDTLSNSELQVRQTILGFNYNEFSLVTNARVALKVASTVMYDWAHVYVCDGVADAEYGACMQALHKGKAATTYSEFAAYLSSWTFPKMYGDLAHLFSESANRNNVKKGSFTCTASEFLTMAPVLTRYLTHVALPRNELVPHVRSLLAVLRVIELLQAVKRHMVAPDLLRDAIVSHLALHVAAYGADSVRPKHHYAMHLPDMLARFGTLLSTLVHERKHRVVKRYTRNRCNLQSWDLGAMEDVTCHQLYELAEPFMHGKAGSRPSARSLLVLEDIFPKVAADAFTLHASIAIKNGLAKKGDVVLFGLDGHLEVGEVLMSIGVKGPDAMSLSCIISCWEPLADRTDDPCYRKLLVQDRAVQVAASCLECATVHNFAKNGKHCVVHIPFEYRL